VCSGFQKIMLQTMLKRDGDSKKGHHASAHIPAKRTPLRRQEYAPTEGTAPIE
jgi:hypothetical protein